jgi:DNA-binding transcriptional regulator YiaG
MNLNLHKNARTTPAIRQELRESTKSERELAREYHLNRATVRKWRQRETGVDDISTGDLTKDLVSVDLSMRFMPA